jgi:hypothetical protein
MPSRVQGAHPEHTEVSSIAMLMVCWARVMIAVSLVCRTSEGIGSVYSGSELQSIVVVVKVLARSQKSRQGIS